MIVVFGGAFNPPTIAHYEVAKHVAGLPFVEQLLFVPVGDHYEKAELIPAFHRLEMLEILVSKLPKTSLSKIETESERVLKTIETLEQLEVEYPNSELAFIMGADNLYQLTNWYAYERFIHKFKILILNRDMHDVHAFIKEKFATMTEQFIVINDFPKINVSSSAYRADITRTEILLPEVEIYIKTHGLYK